MYSYYITLKDDYLVALKKTSIVGEQKANCNGKNTNNNDAIEKINHVFYSLKVSTGSQKIFILMNSN